MSKKKILFEIDEDVIANFKALSARSKIPMKLVLADVLKEVNKTNLYTIKNN